jgi:hypothetical protein
MRVHYFICGLLFLCGCTSELNDSDFTKNLESLDRINARLLTVNNPEKLNGDSTFLTIEELLMGDTSDFHKLTSDLNLRDVVYHNEGGIEYKFGTGLKYDYQYYMIYFTDLGSKTSLLSYEQFVDYRIECKDITDHWTFVKVKESN